MHTILIIEFFNPQNIIQYGGLALLLFIIFAETGLFFGFFLPGDSLLFVAGLLTTSKYIDQPIGVLLLLLIICAFAGTCVGYFFGVWATKYLKPKDSNLFFKQKYLDIAQAFYTKYGMMAFIVGRFLPIVRTFVPILAGMVKIEFKKFLFYNLLGAALWISTLVLSGYWLGSIFPSLVDNVEFIIVGLIIVTAIPVVISYRKAKGSSVEEVK
ncbi:MAG: VTT domain-containing protein [Chryseolinea sp.]